ncbi:unnamed protein product [Blumeria hordei]|uniref:Small ribosomal subunit protein mS41 n=2 Tax=Blumeria hordei TaxID=2867405 RepID=A0A383UPI9_BLUHO|nr:unnamed protein product [Blumeria hordei]
MISAKSLTYESMRFKMLKYPKSKPVSTLISDLKKISQARNNSTTTTELTSKKFISAKRRVFWVPSPSKFVPDVQTFLSLIGRNMSEHCSKIPGWASLFRLKSTELKNLGIEPPRSRRYLLRWREKYRQGVLGPGADFKYIKDGVALLGIAKVPKDPKLSKDNIESMPTGMRKIVVNIPLGASVEDIPREKLSQVKGYRVRGAHTIVGPFALPVKGGKGATVTRKEGMWEMKRGRKIDGGERRQAQVRAMRRGEEKRAAV